LLCHRWHSNKEQEQQDKDSTHDDRARHA
jgi:hypothetical protein